MLRELSTMRIVDREQAKLVGGFGSTRRVNARLLLLSRAGLLHRLFMGLAPATRKILYFLSPLGARLVGVSRQGGPRRRNNAVVLTDSFVEHQFGINDIYCRVKYHPIRHPGATFVRWESPALPNESSLLPDGYFEIATPEKMLAAFLEFDLGHEGLAVWRGKVQKYLTYMVSGDFESTFEQPGFRVLVVANSDRRLADLRTATAMITDKVFWFTTTDSIHRDGFWSPIWFRPRGDHEPISLL